MSGTNIKALEPMKCVFVSKPKTEDAIFRLHHNFTTKVLMVVAALTLTNSISNSIVCYSSDRSLPTAILNAYCSMQNTFILSDALDKRVGVDVAHPGVDTYVAGSTDRRIFQRYYIWVPVFLVLQATLFYVPHYVWRQIEPNKINHLLASLHRPIVVVVEEGFERLDSFVTTRRKNLAKYLYRTQHSHRGYLVGYLTCLALALTNVIGQIFFVDHLLEGEFRDYGWAVLGFWTGSRDVANRTDPMMRIFPRMTKCTYHQFGAGGSVQNHDVVCAMPFNLYYEKIFIALWFWYVILAVLTGLDFLWQLLAVAVRRIRNWRILPSKPELDDNQSSAYTKGRDGVEGDDEDMDKDASNRDTLPVGMTSSGTSRVANGWREPLGTGTINNFNRGESSGSGRKGRSAADVDENQFDIMKRVLDEGDVGDWFMLSLLQKNISENHFEKIMYYTDRLLRMKPEFDHNMDNVLNTD